ncbi:hypothetical protein B0H66DRAFT_164986 [Apodospora peruviana]|uniref:Knr4/Smi1-like domain-containing protein n=1 Tax=Apodospora peruviana TaxID=516989 RepID=A0AAE0MCE4_9PEZI|nr:hypothetical protein B0H66DRAFT_164986 [Apodospora peruviana]
MASSIGAVFRSFWHTMTSNDRHSTPDSPYRTGRHVPLNRAGGLTSIATASESRADISLPYHDEFAQSRQSTSGFNDTAYGGSSASTTQSPLSPGMIGRPYSPGMQSLRTRSTNDGFETQNSPAGEIPMQSFQDGLPPAPSVASSWNKIDKWADENYPELFDQLCEGATVNDLNELEHQLDCSLPQDVRQSLQIHDGQERGGTPTGIIFSSMLLDCEEIVQEWENWRKVNQEFLLETTVAVKPSLPSKALGGSNSSQASSSRQAASSPAPVSPSNPHWRQDLLARQDCVPPGAVQRAYAHPAWIPLVRDWGGNNLAVDLAPGPTGTWGQIILFGRDYDTKYVVARSWSALLSIVADDLSSGRWFVDEETGELKLREFKRSRVEPAYFDILRWRMDQKFGRSAAAAAAANAAKRRSGVPGSPTMTPGSPYASPTDSNGEASRGRSMQRLSSSGHSPIASPRPGGGGFGPKSSPLARLDESEESGGASSAATTATTTPMGLAVTIPNGKPREKLVEVDTPRPSGEENKENVLHVNGVVGSPLQSTRLAALVNGVDETTSSEQQSQQNGTTIIGNGKASAAVQSSKQQPVVALEEAMKTIEI